MADQLIGTKKAILVFALSLNLSLNRWISFYNDFLSDERSFEAPTGFVLNIGVPGLHATVHLYREWNEIHEKASNL